MIKILTPISHLFTESDRIPSEIVSRSDCLEARERTSHLRLPSTTHYHIDFDLNIGLNQNQLDFLRNEVRDRDYITTLTFQAARDCEKIICKNGMYIPNSSPLSLTDQIVNTNKSIDQIRDIVGSDRSIGIENNNFYPTGAYNISTSLSYLLDVLCINGLHLLLDVAHAKVTAFNLDIDFNAYINPLLETGLCRQVHICEPKVINTNTGSLMIDAHDLPSEQFTESTIYLMNKFKIPYLTCEYYKSSSKLSNYLHYVKSLIANI